MSKIFLFDAARCSGCYNCQLACKDEHCGNNWLPYAARQPLTGQFWCKVTEHVQGTIPKVKMFYTVRLCAHCADAACMKVCPVKAISRREDGLVLIDPGRCAGCGACERACPNGAIYFNEELNISQKCTGCAHLLDNGVASAPRCAEACPTDALVYGEEADLADKLAGAKPLTPGGRVYVKNIPGEFIGGTVYDPVEKEVIIGASCVLKGEDGALKTETDSYGDFWFRDLPAGKTYTLDISAPGFRTKQFTGLVTEKSINLDDIPLEKG